ncbi:hypothetical protein RSAG8_03543, partial [Rhizoctonia solani AG-8 WAC10335]
MPSADTHKASPGLWLLSPAYLGRPLEHRGGTTIPIYKR